MLFIVKVKNHWERRILVTNKFSEVDVKVVGLLDKV